MRGSWRLLEFDSRLVYKKLDNITAGYVIYLNENSFVNS